MPNSFIITSAIIDPLKLDAKGRAQCVFTVTNNTARSMRGLARAKALGASSASWTNDVGDRIILTPTHDGLPQGAVVNRDKEILENGTTATKVIETHPKWQQGGNITGTYILPQPLSAGDKFRTQIGFLQGAAHGAEPSVRCASCLMAASLMRYPSLTLVV